MLQRSLGAARERPKPWLRMQSCRCCEGLRRKQYGGGGIGIHSINIPMELQDCTHSARVVFALQLANFRCSTDSHMDESMTSTRMQIKCFISDFLNIPINDVRKLEHGLMPSLTMLPAPLSRRHGRDKWCVHARSLAQC